jgi:hypothetical protein
MSDLFARIARHGISGDRDPREDRLTEICAALFESPHCRDLARQVAIAWLRQAETTEPEGPAAVAAARLRQLLADDAPEWSCDVATQVHTVVGDETRRPDLELVFQAQTGTAPEVSIWVEVKHGTAPHHRQLWSYVEAQRVQGGIVLLVAPRSSYPFPEEELPPAVPQLTWERTATAISKCNPGDVVGQFLVDELCAYLKGEGLMDPDRVTPLHMVALANYREALRTLEALWNATAEKMPELWSTAVAPYESGRGDGGTVSDKHWGYPTSRSSEPSLRLSEPWETWGLYWGRIIDSAQILRDGRPGVALLFAGVGTERQGSLAALGEDRQDRLRNLRFRLLDARSAKTSNEHIWRVAYPEDLLAGGDLDAQATQLADWVVDAFTEVRAVLIEDSVAD